MKIVLKILCSCTLITSLALSQEDDSNGRTNVQNTADYSPKSSASNQILSDSLKDIPEIIGYTNKSKKGIIKYAPLDNLNKATRPLYLFYRDRMNLDLAIAYTTLYQRATSGPSYTEAAGDDFDFYGVWTICDEKSKHPTSISFECESRSKWTTIPPQDLGESIGSLWKTVNAFSDYSFILTQVWWEYQLIRNRFGFRVGKIDLSDYFNLYSFASTNYNFLNQGLVDDITIPFPQNGLGAVIGYKTSEEFFFFIGIGDMNGKKRSLCFDTFFKENEYFKGLEFCYKPKIRCVGRGNYNIMFWHSDPVKNDEIKRSKGIAISMEQEFRTGFVPFLRFGFSDGKASDVKRSVSAGFGFIKPFCREDDQFAIGGTWGKPKDPNLSSQFMMETYYRLQLTQYIEVTPDIELIVNPTYNTNDNVIGVFSVRVRIGI